MTRALTSYTFEPLSVSSSPSPFSFGSPSLLSRTFCRVLLNSFLTVFLSLRSSSSKPISILPLLHHQSPSLNQLKLCLKPSKTLSSKRLAVFIFPANSCAFSKSIMHVRGLTTLPIDFTLPFFHTTTCQFSRCAEYDLACHVFPVILLRTCMQYIGSPAPSFP
jgi:hypothetical protein